MSEDQAGELVLLVETNDVTLLPVLKSVLEAAAVPHVVQGDEALGLFPISPAGPLFSGRAWAARVLVPREHLEEARALLDSFEDDPDGRRESD
jgi:hypothetical protein